MFRAVELELVVDVAVDRTGVGSGCGGEERACATRSVAETSLKGGKPGQVQRVVMRRSPTCRQLVESAGDAQQRRLA
jgi:hypothetical protein